MAEENNQATEDKVIKAKNIGVYFQSGKQQDDYKSKVFRFFKNRGRIERPKEIWPLKDINFEGLQGEILGIIGSNGAGKTTLSKIITGILLHDQGEMRVDGKVTALFSFGMGFNKELTGRENVYLNGMMLGIDKSLINKYIDDIHVFSDLGEFMDQPMKYYSSGMKARLGFSVAAHLEPEILILDEALNTGDAQFSQKAAQKMKELVKRAKMVIIVTHSLPYAQRNCDRLIWVDGGVIREDGDPKEVVANYKATLPPRPPRKKRLLQLDKTETKVQDSTVVKAENVGVSFQLKNKGEFWALKNMDFEIKAGEVVGIIGHNGAGKSTLCKVLTKIYQPDEGQIELNGETSALLGYGTGFNAQLTGSDNIYLNAMLLGIPKKRVDEKYDEIVEFSGIKAAIDRPVKEYSSGMKSRLGFSIAATLKPDIFIIDEALSTGDLAFQEKASERIQDMIEGAKAVIIVSHNMNFVEKVCTRALWMEQGQVRFDGTAEEAVAKYRESLGLTNNQKTVKRQTRTK
ncbi:ABC transporter ATP-binding protein [Lentibacillus salicampi]|uniref:ATP-binding cassette domain-containing protein n=1 Tax=Lentibacillus salicampi TaxID=175306 RepID=A0A4Y9A8Y1_9BACI|nr:ATP-binding cassette domain-containing protein [Lentibacillus salicampi]TFJ91567.1 ATP-binding cassette domain-containing protein [Lentibacillus salicampi]